MFWKLLYYGILINLPEKFFGNKLRSFVCRRIFAEAGKNIIVRKGALFGSGGKIQIGDNSRIGTNCRLMISEKIIIGKNVEMGPDVIIMDINHEFDKVDIPIIRQGYKAAKPVIIEDDVWIGARVIILPGITIKKGTVIGAGSIVTKDTFEYSIVAGNPSRIIGSRILSEKN